MTIAANDDFFIDRDKLIGAAPLAPELDAARSTLPVRLLGAILLIGIAVIHYMDLGGKLKETPYLGELYIALIASSALVALMLTFSKSRIGWHLAVTIAASTIAGYVISRTTGLPNSTDDIGNWTETLGIASLAVEGLLVIVGIAAARAPAE